MEAANALLNSLRSRIGASESLSDSGGFDWSGLHARLSAAHAARRELQTTDSFRLTPRGAFTQWAASAQPAAKPSRRVNQTNLTDGKAVCRMAAAVAGHSTVGD
ncbi:hypothetical protein [Novosphingobium sp.]|uniref:hypothetical protein n=1 Tax=Novosphingobium sp. TaxID=1874826 RepID=UPI003C7A9082